MFALAKDRSEKGSELRAVVVDALKEAIAENDRVVALEADLGGASGWLKIAAAAPENFVQCGISEANMVGVAAGMSSEGFVPFVHTFAPFATRRVFDQVFLSGAYAQNTLNIYGSDPGFTVGFNGGTHTSWEDMALMRAIPGAVVCDAADAVQMHWIIKEFSELASGVHYVRGNRKDVRKVYEEGSTFALGKGNLLQEGTDVLIVSCGQLVSDALDAAEELERVGVSCAVIDMFCVKPLDEALLLQQAAGKRLVVSFENHGVIGGLGDACAAVLAEHNDMPRLVRHGVRERFGQVGTPAFLQQEFGLTANDLVKTVQKNLQAE